MQELQQTQNELIIMHQYLAQGEFKLKLGELINRISEQL